MLFTEEELQNFERENSDGLSSAEIVEMFCSRGVKLSEATFRKYVQLGLLPRSRRVGTKGKHKGSRGVYPVVTVRQINEIKRLMSYDFTIEEISNQFVFIGGELEELRGLIQTVVEKMEKGIAESGFELMQSKMKLQILEAKETANELIDKLEHTADEIRKQVEVAKEAV